jgi:hypothetical protein
MRKKFVGNIIVLLAVLLLGGHRQEASHKTRQAAEKAFGGLPLYFEPNAGQFDNSVKFQARGAVAAIELTNSGIAVREKNAEAIHMQFVGCNHDAEVVGLNRLPGKSNYLIGPDSKNWQTGVPQFAKVQYKGMYPGIDVVFHANQKELEYDFVLGPGADPNSIRMDFDTAGLRIKEGALVIPMPEGEMRQLKPVVYQEVKGSRRRVEAHYVMRGGAPGHRIAGFSVDSYDRTKPLVIDPVFQVMANGNTPVFGVTSDAAGNWYLAGGTNATGLPTTNPFQAACAAGCQDAYIVKLNPALDTILYSTFLGGSGNDWAYGIGVDAAGNIHVAGDTESPDFPLSNAFQSAKKGSATDLDAFVSVLNPAGNTLIFSTYLSGSSFDQVGGLAVDTGGSTYITGTTLSTDFPTKAPFQPANAGAFDAFIAKFSLSGSLVYSTYLGGTSADYGNAIAVDPSGNAYIAGKTSSPSFPTVNPFQKSQGTPFATTAFVAKVNSSGSALIYSTYWGGSNFDEALAIAADASGNAYVTGRTTSTDFPTLKPFQPSIGPAKCVKPPILGTAATGCTDGFVFKLTATGAAVFSSWFGGSDNDEGDGIALDGSGQIYIAGTTSSTDLPLVNPLQPGLGGLEDMFIATVKPDGSALTFSTYLGTAADEFAKPGTLAINANGGSASSGSTLLIAIGGGSEFNKQTTGEIQTISVPAPPPPAGEADLAVVWVAVKEEFNNGVSLQIQVKNLGPQVAEGVTLSLGPVNWLIESVYSDRPTGTCSLSSCALGSLADGDSEFVYVGGADPALTGSSLQVTASDSGPDDPFKFNNTATINFYTGSFTVLANETQKSVSLSPDVTGLKAFGGAILQEPQTNVRGRVAAASSTMPAALAVFGLSENNALITEAGVPAANAVMSARIFMDTTSGANTGIAAVNPNTASINITASARDTTGVLVSSSTITLPPNGHKAAFPNELGLNLPSNFLGTLTLSSASPFAAVALRLSTNTHGETLFSALPVVDLNSTATASSLIVPQIVDGGGIPTRLLLMNTSSSMTATGTISLFDDNGSPLSADFGALGRQSQLSYSLQPDGMIKFSTTGIGQTRAGYAVVTPQSGPLPAGSAIFGANNSAGLTSEAGVLPAPPTTSARMYTEVSSSDVMRNTGMALVNPNATAATVNLTLVDNLTGQVRTNTLNLAANGHNGKLLTELFPDVPANSFQGTLTLTSNVAIASVALRLTTNQRGDLILSTLPVADLNNPPATTQYLAQIVVGGGYTTELILINTASNSSTVRMNFYDDNGTKVASPFP